MEVLIDDVIRVIYVSIDVGLSKDAFGSTCRRMATIWRPLRPLLNTPASISTSRKMFLQFMNSDDIDVDYILMYDKRYKVFNDKKSEIKLNFICMFIGQTPTEHITDGLDRLFDVFPDLKLPTRGLPVLVFLLAYKRVAKSAIKCYLAAWINIISDNVTEYSQKVSIDRWHSDTKLIISRYHWWPMVMDIFGNRPLRTMLKVLIDPYSNLVQLPFGARDNPKWTIKRSCQYQYDVNWNI
jgi:hypothetical protein